jgi:hypothetical protein
MDIFAGRIPTHDFYNWLSPELCQDGWQAEATELSANICHAPPHNIGYAAMGLFLVTFVLLVWIWLKPLRK